MSETVEMTRDAASVHCSAWERIVEAALEDPQAKYGIYASRTLAVSHPEIYLIADGWFADGARRLKGFKECYEEPTALGWCHMEYGGAFFRQKSDYTGIPGAHPLLLSEVRLSEYRPVSATHIYPEPFFPVVDQRLGPLAVTLKTEGRVVTPLELATIAYFQRREADENPAELFVVWCEDGSAYVVSGNSLWDAVAEGPAEHVCGAPLLIFNERSAWYPLMGRDDRPSDARLARAADLLGVEAGEPSLEEWERELIPRLKAATALRGDRQLRMAGIAAVRAGGWRFHPYAESWHGLVPEEDLDIDISRRLGIVRELDLWANRVSPVTAHLYATMSQGSSARRKITRLSREILMRTGMVRETAARGWKQAWRLESWGHLWPCGLMEHTIDDAYRSRTGHCVSQSHMVAAVLEAAGIPHVVVNFDRGGVSEGVNHHFVLSQDGAFLMDDGIVNYRGVDAETEDYGPLLSFSIDGEWASTVGDKLYGNISSQRCGELIERIEQALAGRFPLRFYLDEDGQRIVEKSEFLAFLETREVERVGLP